MSVMQAAVVHEFGKNLVVEEVPVPAPGPGQALKMVPRRNGRLQRTTPGEFPVSDLDIVIKGLTVRGSIVGTRADMIEALDFYARDLIHPTVATRKLEEINDIFNEMKRGAIDGRMVITY